LLFKEWLMALVFNAAGESRHANKMVGEAGAVLIDRWV
jgi:hypothetical protein